MISGSSTPVLKWLFAIYLISHENLKINATELTRIIKVTYKTAWLILHKIPVLVGTNINNQNEPGYVKNKLIPDENLKEKEIYHSGINHFTKADVVEGTLINYHKPAAPQKRKPVYFIFKASRK